MKDGFLIGRVRLRFSKKRAGKIDPRDDLSAVAIDGDGTLWSASDELSALERFRPDGAGTFSDHKTIGLAEAFQLPDPDETAEIDIEGLSHDDGVLWLTGSHTSTRRKPKGDEDMRDLERLTEVKFRPNRYVIGRLSPKKDGTPDKIARLPYTGSGNSLTDALRDDPHLGPYLEALDPGSPSLQIPTKENGFDIEGLAVRNGHAFLGLRGPVFRGWASLFLEIEPKEAGNGQLDLKPIGNKGQLYRKHFVDLDGMGVRDLSFDGDDLLILSGPTMDLTGRQSVWRLKDAADLDDDSLTQSKDKRLKKLFDLPIVPDGDKAEGIERYDALGEPGLLVIYDAPQNARKPDERTVLGDVFRLA
ncbi:MAG: DUF3616 domain-containing protein [Pseudomonadota bacterium]